MRCLTDYISPAQAGNLGGLFRERVARSPKAVAYRQFDTANGRWFDTTWADMAREASRWQNALAAEDLHPGDRVALMLRNRREWVLFDQAALALDLVLVPLYPNDRPDNVGFIIEDADVKVLLLEDVGQWDSLRPVLNNLTGLRRIVTLARVHDENEPRLTDLTHWLPPAAGALRQGAAQPEDLATIVYTSGTMGRPKGVMLSHENILWNAWSGAHSVIVCTDDVFLSFLPLSHTLERTVGYYIPMLAGASVAYARSIPQLAEDFVELRPTLLVTVPRIFERVYNKIQAQLARKSAIARGLFALAVRTGWQRFQHRQNRASWHPTELLWPLLYLAVARTVVNKLGGRLRAAISGGAPLAPNIARVFIGLGLEISQGYGLTEASPVISTNLLDDNDPASVGQPLMDVQVKLGRDNELLVRSPGVMLGYWNNPEATRQMIDVEGWLHTGDQARIERGHIYITGRIKEIIVLANGEKVAPADMEMAICAHPMFEQVMIVGEQKPFLSALLVLNPEHWAALANQLNLDAGIPDSLEDQRVEEVVLEHIAHHTRNFPGYAVVRRATLTLTPWSIEEGLLTPTMKLRRAHIIQQHADSINRLYEGH